MDLQSLECSEKLLVESGHEGLIPPRLSCNLNPSRSKTWRPCYNQTGSGHRMILNADGLIKKNGETTNTLSFSDEWALSVTVPTVRRYCQTEAEAEWQSNRGKHRPRT
jgi:hypothetical protein